MKVAVSIPDPVFAQADQLAKRLNLSRSTLYARALNAFVDQHDDDQITARINEVLADIDQTEDLAFVRAASRNVIKHTDW